MNHVVRRRIESVQRLVEELETRLAKVHEVLPNDDPGAPEFMEAWGALVDARVSLEACLEAESKRKAA